MAKVKYGDILDFNKSPIEQHSISKKSDIAKDMAVWSIPVSQVDEEQHKICLLYTSPSPRDRG